MHKNSFFLIKKIKDQDSKEFSHRIQSMPHFVKENITTAKKAKLFTNSLE